MKEVEKLKDELKKRGFSKIVVVNDKPHAHYALHEHSFPVEIVVIKGSVNLMVDKKEVELKAGEKLGIEVNEEHSVKTGAEGAKYIVAERK